MGMDAGKWSVKPNVPFESKLWMISENSKVLIYKYLFYFYFYFLFNVSLYLIKMVMDQVILMRKNSVI
jgi:hypothetical protein